MSVESSQATETGPVHSRIEALRASDDVIASLRARIETLEAQQRDARPSLLSPKLVAVVGSIVAAVIPLTTAIDGYLKWRADLAVSAQQQLHAARMDSLKTVLSAQLPELERESRLRLLLAMLEPSDAIHAWAEGELGRVEKTVQQLEEEKVAALQEREAWEAKAADAAAKLTVKGSNLPEVLSGLELSGVHDEEPAAASGPTPPPEPAAKPPKAVTATAKLAPEVVEYQKAKRMSDAATNKANARARRLTGSNAY